MFCHLGHLIGFYISAHHLDAEKKMNRLSLTGTARRSINFGISMLIWVFVTCCIGAIVLAPLSIYFSIMAGLAANRSGIFRVSDDDPVHQVKISSPPRGQGSQWIGGSKPVAHDSNSVIACVVRRLEWYATG